MKRLSETFSVFVFVILMLVACGSTEGSHPGYHPGIGMDTGTGTGTGTGIAITNLMGGAIQKQLTLTGSVTTFAGGAGISGSTDGTGTAARFYHPYVITTDGINLYVGVNQTIRKIALATGVVTTLAGSAGVTTHPSGSVSDGTGTAARFYGLQGITTDGTNLYVVDGEYTIRKVIIATGVVTTLAGAAYPDTPAGSTDGTGAAARFYNPQGITTDGTNLYVVDSGNSTIRKVVIATGVVTTLAGSVGVVGSVDGTGPAAQFNYPTGITTDGMNLYVTDRHIIRKVVIATGVVTTLTDGAGIVAWFDYPYGITMDGTNLYVTDHYIHAIRKVAIATGVVTMIAGSAGMIGSSDGTGIAAQFNYPAGITTDGLNLYVADSLNHTIRKIQ